MSYSITTFYPADAITLHCGILIARQISEQLKPGVMKIMPFDRPVFPPESVPLHRFGGYRLRPPKITRPSCPGLMPIRRLRLAKKPDQDGLVTFGSAGWWNKKQMIFRRGCGGIFITPAQAFPVLTKRAGNTTAYGCGCEHAASGSWIDKSGAAFARAMEDFPAVGHYLVIGAIIAALAQTYVDRSSFLSLTSAPSLSVVSMMALAVLLNLCSEADAFIAAFFRGLMSIPAQMAFLLTGPMFDLKLLLMYQNVFKRRAIAVLASLILGAVLAVSVGLETQRTARSTTAWKTISRNWKRFGTICTLSDTDSGDLT